MQDGQNTDDKTNIEIAQDLAADQLYGDENSKYIYSIRLEYDEGVKA